MLGYNKEITIEGIEGQERNEDVSVAMLSADRWCNQAKKKERKETMRCDRLWEVLWPSVVTDTEGGVANAELQDMDGQLEEEQNTGAGMKKMRMKILGMQSDKNW